SLTQKANLAGHDVLEILSVASKNKKQDWEKLRSGAEVRKKRMRKF
ncbi:unnamed protein product, partial [Allacma fusca]